MADEPVNRNYWPQIAGVPFDPADVEARERLAAEARDKPSSPLGDSPAEVLRHCAPLVLEVKYKGWEADVRQAVRDGAVIQGIRDDPEVSAAIADESMKIHERQASRARQTLYALKEQVFKLPRRFRILTGIWDRPFEKALRHGVYFPDTDLTVNDMGERGTGKPQGQIEWIDPEA